MNKKMRKFIMQAICLSILASSAPSALAADFSDTQNHWASEAIDTWSEYEIVHGYDGVFRPDDTMTRGELAVMLDRIMGYHKTADNTYSDLGDEWYTDAMLKLSAVGIIQGYDGKIRPEDPITREEAAVILVRALEIKSQNGEAPSFTDTDNVSEWARDAVYALAENGYVNGFEDNTFRPQQNMSRAEFVTIINNAVKGFYTEAGTYTSNETIKGIVIVNAADVILENMEIDGHLILAPGVKEGTVTLKNTTVSGEIITQGGNIHEDNSGGGSNEESPTATPAPTSSPGGSGGSGGGSGGGSSITTAAETSIVVNSSYEGKTGTVVSNQKRYTIGKNAFSSLKEAAEQAGQLEEDAEITLLSDLTADETIEIHKGNLSIDGGNHSIEFAAGVKDGIQVVNSQEVDIKNINIKMQDETGKWNGSYGIQAYGDSNITLTDISVSGADAAVLVNGAEVLLGGVVDVSGNEFGGIEVSKGADVESMPRLIGVADNLKNDSESMECPTVWIDKVSSVTTDAVNINGLIQAEKTEKDQMFYYLNPKDIGLTADVSNIEELEAALTNENTVVINVTGNIDADKTLSVTRAVTINGSSDDAAITFNNMDGIEIVNAGNIRLENIKVEVTNNESGWQGLYGIQVYGASKAVFNNITVTGADAAIVVNGAEAAIEGIVDVSGNEFGGIEVSKGVDVQTSPKLTGAAENLKNDSESASNPTIWIDKVSSLATNVVEVTGLENVSYEDKDQEYFFINGIPESITAEAATPEELENAIADPEIKIITITNEITADNVFSINRSITLKGQSNARADKAGLIFDNTDGIEIVNAGNVTIEDINVEIINNSQGWQGLYGIQAYGESNVVLKNVSVTEADAAILVNGAEVLLEGIVDVSGNEFGGIEVAKGVDVESMPALTGSAANLKNDSESDLNPTVWIDKASELTTDVVKVSGMIQAEPNEKDQIYFYLNSKTDSSSAEVSNQAELETALADEKVKIINISGSISSDKVLSVTREIIIKGSQDGASIIFDSTDGIEIVNAGSVTLEDVSIEIVNNELGWQGLYGIQAYGDSNVVLKNISVKGADAAILVNGAQTSLEGVVDVSGNEFGGIEVSKGVGVEFMPGLAGAAANLKNDSESASNPTIWIDKVSEITSGVVEVSDMHTIQMSEKDQLYFFINDIENADISQ